MARLRAILNAHGYDASDRDIQAAYSDWSEEEYAAGWMWMGDMPDDRLFSILWSGLQHDDRPDGRGDRP